MRVKEAVLTFVAMGGFAVPVVFSSSPASASSQNTTQSPAVAAADDEKNAKQG